MVLLSLLLSLSANAQDCKAIPKALKKASPHEASSMYVTLSKCNPAAAKKAAATTIPGLLGDEGGQDAAIAAIHVGAGDVTRKWIHGLDAEERAPMLRVLGKACSEDEAVQGFLSEAAAALGDDFWSQRWYRSLVHCRVPAMQKILGDHLEKSKDATDRAPYFAVLSAWAQNLAGAAVPQLEKMIAETTDVEMQVHFIQAFVDAAQVGSLSGMDAQVAEAGASAIKRLSVSLPFRAVEQSRRALMALDDEQGADALAKVRYNDLLQGNGMLLYGVVLVERASCKKDQTHQVLHIAKVTDPGQTWPDQLEDKVMTSAKYAWKMTLGKKCKDEAVKLMARLPDAPFADKKAYKAWVEDTVKGLKTEDVHKTTEKDHDPIAL